ncbi:MAG: hypothetical protein JWP89_3880 [Schlesneria sp.]|nr:hypothetical protein [Schlesneria sp.]
MPGLSCRGQAGSQDLIGGVIAGRHGVIFSLSCAVSSEPDEPARLPYGECVVCVWARGLTPSRSGKRWGQRGLGRHLLRNRNL